MIAVATEDPGALPATVRGIPIVGLPLLNGFGESLRETLRVALRLPRSLWTTYGFLRANRVVAVHSVFPGLGGATLLLLKLAGLFEGELAVSFHGLDVTSVERGSRFTKALWKWYLKRLDKVVCCSATIRSRVARLAPAAPLRVVFNGADVELFNMTRSSFGMTPLRILHIGKFERKKAQDVLLAAFRILLDKGIDANLTMIGASGPETESTRRLASTFGPRVVMLEHIPHHQLPAYFAEANLFVLPSREEPFGIVLLEAGAAGLPIVATRSGGIPEFLDHGRTALLVEPDAPEELADAIFRMVHVDGLAASLAHEWHLEAMEFSWTKVAQGYFDGVEGLSPARSASIGESPAAGPSSLSEPGAIKPGEMVDESRSRSSKSSRPTNAV